MILTIPNYLAITIKSTTKVQSGQPSLKCGLTPNGYNGSHYVAKVDEEMFKSDGQPFAGGTAESYFDDNNVTLYLVNFSQLAQRDGQVTWLYTVNIWIYSFILKFIPSVILTVITGLLIRGIYKADRRAERLKNNNGRAAAAAAGRAGSLQLNCAETTVRHSGTQQRQHLEVCNGSPQEGEQLVRKLSNVSNHLGPPRKHSRKKTMRRKSTDRTTRLLIVILLLFLLTEFPQVGKYLQCCCSKFSTWYPK